MAPGEHRGVLRPTQSIKSPACFSARAPLLFLVISLSEHLGQPGAERRVGTGASEAAAEQNRRDHAGETPPQMRGSRDQCPDILAGDMAFHRTHLCQLSCPPASDTTV